MSPVEAAKVDDSLTRESILQALSDHTPEQLRERARRLCKSTDGMKEMLVELEVEKRQLQEETDQYKNTIELVMQELKKLNIGSVNTVEPQLEGGPLDFVGRFWEKVKPRDTAFLTSEHVGEIKKPNPDDVETPNVQQVVKEASEQAVKTAQRIQGALGPWWQRTQGFLNEKQNEFTDAVASRARQHLKAPEPKKKSGNKKRDGAGYPEKQAPPAAPVSETAEVAASSSSSSGVQAEVAAAVAAVATPEVATPELKPQAESSPAPATVPEPTLTPEPEVTKETAAPPCEVPAAVPAVEPRPSGGRGPAEDQINSTLLIEASLKVDDGSILKLQVRAQDRCKEVAKRFVSENSLKAWFQDPLANWLKQVESDADKFPVLVEANLTDIRKQYSKSK